MLLDALKRFLPGETLHSCEIPLAAGASRLSLHVKRERGTQRLYVALGLRTAGEYLHQHLSPKDLVQLSELVQETADALLRHGEQQGASSSSARHVQTR